MRFIKKVLTLAVLVVLLAQVFFNSSLVNNAKQNVLKFIGGEKVETTSENLSGDLSSLGHDMWGTIQEAFKDTFKAY